MAATYETIRNWCLSGKEEGATHVIVVCDTFSYEDYPVFVKPEENIQEKVTEYRSKSMQRVMEVYNLALDINTQLNKGRVWNL